MSASAWRPTGLRKNLTNTQLLDIAGAETLTFVKRSRVADEVATTVISDVCARC